MSSHTVTVTVMTFGIEIDLVVECDVEPAEAATWDSPGCAGCTEIVKVHRARDKERNDLLPEMEDEEVERLTALVDHEFDSRAEDAAVDYELDLAEARMEREMSRWP